ncbi:MAG: methionyl-tRNA formyltransferase [Proteobacteria bacterium]|nr:methionyl-tRNA formyltransferase [Pseudomonadota bacterium]MBU1715713.1 methionyl-tRNA formyltransferase [Pseudomonadota bacterium]
MTKNPFRIIFMGTPEFAVPSLQALINHGEEVVAVVTQPDRPKGRGRKLTPPPVKEIAETAGIPVLQPTKIRTPEFLAEIAAFKPDIIAVTAYGRILPGPLLDLPPHGTINVHGSILPKYRGAAPIQWAVLNGEVETGVTIMQMDEGLDTGDILLPGTLPIGADDTAGSMAEKLAVLGGNLLTEALDLIRAGNLSPQKQDNSQASLAPLLTKEQGLINWQKPAFAISCLLRGLDPWPMAYTTMGDKWLRLFRPTVIEHPVSEEPGTLCRADQDGLLIATGQNYLLVREIQRQDGRRMAVEDFLRGHPLIKGTRFG